MAQTKKTTAIQLYLLKRLETTMQSRPLTSAERDTLKRLKSEIG